MVVYVDDLQPTEQTVKWPFPSSCHMTADTTAELVAMARAIGLNVKWIQHAGRPTEHFDLTPNMRQRAVTLGAVQETRREAGHRFWDSRAT